MTVFDKAPVLPDDLAKLSDKELNELCGKLRARLIEAVSKNGGHLASNLGVVELTVALYSVYNPYYDRIVWDVGHQTYVHKILTGRDADMDGLRRCGGISGFPKRTESEADCFNTGHSSTSVSAALGLARGYKLAGENRRVVAVIGDGAFTGGMALEALNDAAQSKCNITVVLNDNGMSIDKNVGGVSKYLAKIRKKHSYMLTKRKVRHFLAKIPKVGAPIARFLTNQKNRLKKLLYNVKIFENLGFYYIGPINGHDIYAMKLAFERAGEIDGPVFVHVQTQKGRGYEPAEKEPEYYHGVNNFNAETGAVIKSDSVSLSGVFANKLCEMAENDPKITAITAAMSKGTGLSVFAEKFPERFFDVGIAEQHAVTMAAGLSASGMKPVATIYSTFLQRAYDQLLHDVSVQGLPLVVTLDRAGLCGFDGETHHGIYDFAYLGSIPKTAVFAPSNAKTLEKGLEMAMKVYDGAYENVNVFAIRYPARERFAFADDPMYIDSDFSFGRGRVVFDTTAGGACDVLLVPIGEMLGIAFDAAKRLSAAGKRVVVYDALFLSQQGDEIVKLAERSEKIITLEDAELKNGFGEGLKLLLGCDKITCLGVGEETVCCDSLSRQLEKSGLSAGHIFDLCV